MKTEKILNRRLTSVVLLLTTLSSVASAGTQTALDHPTESARFQELETKPRPPVDDCGDATTSTRPTLCEWYGAADEIVWGTVTALRFPDSPAVTRLKPQPPNYPGYVLTDDCVVTGGHALELDIRVDESLKGRLRRIATVRAGFRHRFRMVPMPVERTDGSIANFDTGARAVQQQDNVGITVGSRVGVALHYLADQNVWSMAGEPVFTISESGAVRFEPLSDYDLLSPDSVRLGADQFWSDLNACGSSPSLGAERRAELRDRLLPSGADQANAMWSFAAKCDPQFEDRTLPPGTCYSDDDCAEPESCNECEGRCRGFPLGGCAGSTDCPEGYVCNECEALCELAPFEG